MKRIFLYLNILIFTNVCIAQNIPENKYRSENNPYYWKNRKPHAAYWQQDIHCKLDARINENDNFIAGNEILTYYNNSPDTLKFLYFHLYQNAFQPGSYLDNLQKNNYQKPRYGKYESEKKGTVINSVSSETVNLNTVLDNTILKVILNSYLLPGDSVKIDIGFTTYFDNGSTRRRMKMFNSFGSRHFDGVHWYPRISVYDAKFGWDTQQHLGKEFYGEFGTYDVSLNFSDNYVVEATGELQNESEVLPKELREKLDIKNFARKPWNEKPSVITPYIAGNRKTWVYHAENVHDFAFTADPNYRIGETTWNNIKCIALVQEPHAALWQNAPNYIAKIIKVYSEDFGMYAYPKMVCADAQDGMEYPMLTLDGGYDPDFRQLFAHEIGHNWFFGMVGNNETYRAMLDEGFTQFLTRWAVEKIDGKYTVEFPIRNKYAAKFSEPDLVQDSRCYYGYMMDAVKENDEYINTHSDGFNGALNHGGGYRHAYYKTATMLYNLQYVLGDELFLKAMQNYFNQWKMCHPYVEDFRNSVINYTKVDLNWFFDQWIETKKVIDYSIKSIKKGEEKNEYKITFKRYGRMQMPLDFTVKDKKDSTYLFHIPNTWFIKKTSGTVLPKWYGWDKLNPTYTATVKLNSKLKTVTIDTSMRLADINMLNNSSRTPLKFKFDSKIYNMPDWKKYELFWRPDLWYNGFSGIKAGIHLNGNYMQHRHIFDFNLWYNTGLGQQKLVIPSEAKNYEKINYHLNYKHTLEKYIHTGYWNVSSKYLDGLISNQIGIEFRDRILRNKIYGSFKSMYRQNNASLNYLLLPGEWNVARFNNTLNLGVFHQYFYAKGVGELDVNIKTSAFTKDYNYSQITLTSINRNKLGKSEINTRFYAQYGWGSAFAPESQLFLAGANPEQMMDNKFTRSFGIIPSGMTGFGSVTNNFAYFGGLGLRGYNGYLMPNTDGKGGQRYAYKGYAGAAENIEWEFDNYFNFKPRWFRNWLHIDSYLFTDAGIINNNNIGENLKFTDIKIDAGIGFVANIKKFGPLQTTDPLAIKVDFPLFLNNPPYLEDKFFKFRWVLGISKTF